MTGAQAIDAVPAASFDVERVRADFPTLARRIHDRPLVYLDSAASALTPQPVIDRISRFYTDEYSNIHRGAHLLSAEATTAYEAARERVASFIGAGSAKEIVFTRGCTEAINLVASCLGELDPAEGGVGAGDEVLLTELEHHSNILPWQRLCEQRGATLKVAPIDDDGQLDLEAFSALLSPKTKLVAVSHVSNVLGTILPVAKICELAHQVGARVLCDGAQGVVHMSVDVQTLGCDFYTFSGHKLYGPTGVGVLWGKQEQLDRLPTYQVGGGTIDEVGFDRSTYLGSPLRFEAGTPHIAGGLGLAAAIDYLSAFDMEQVAAHEQRLFVAATEALEAIPQVRILGRGAAGTQASVRSFVLEEVHPADAGAILDRQGIAVRIGHHCAQPLMKRFGVPATTRASFGIYNNQADVEALAAGVRKVIELFF
jgi:cysteine desulfurase/selenocysteine lyase